MFTNMKNQFREKTGKDVPKFTPQKGGLSRQSRQGSESSISSLVIDSPQPTSSPSPSLAQDSHPIKLSDGKVLTNKEVNILSKKEEEWRQRLEKKEAEWCKKLEKREEELLEDVKHREEEWRKKEMQLTEDLIKNTNELKEALKSAEEFKRKLCQYQEEKDTLEGFQTQEMSKIKHLLLAKEKECSETAVALKETATLVEGLKSEVSRLRPFEEQVSNFQDDLEILRHTSEKERWHLSSKLAQSEEQVRHLTDRVAVLTRRSESDAGIAAALPADDRVQALLGERVLLERRLEEAHVHLSDIKASWSAQIASLETQVGRLSRQAGEEGAERRLVEAKVVELEAKLEEEMKEQERLKGRVLKLSEECNSLANDLKTANALVVSKESEISNLSQKIDEADFSFKELDKDKRRVEDELKAEIEKRGSVEDQMSETALIWTTKEKTLLDEKSNVEKELEEEKEKRKSVAEELEKLRAVYAESTLLNAQMSQEIDEVKQSLKTGEKELALYMGQVAEMTLQAELSTKENSRLEKQVMELTTVLDEMKKKNESIDVENRAKKKEEEQLAEYMDQVAELKLNAEQYHEENARLEEKVKELTLLLDEMKSTREEADVETGLRAKIADLEEQTTEKNKTIKVLQHKLNDMKKTMREMKTAENGTEVFHNHTGATALKTTEDPEVNFLYMKNVIMKFLTSREYEALHLTKAVATLLKLSYEEECLLKDTIGWRMSWFRSKPRPEDYTS